MSSLDSIREIGETGRIGGILEERLETYILDRQIERRTRGIEAMIDFLKLDTEA